MEWTTITKMAADYLAEDYNAVRERRLRDLDRELGYDMSSYLPYAGTPRWAAAVQPRQARYLHDRGRLQDDLDNGVGSGKYDQFYTLNKQRADDAANPTQYDNTDTPQGGIPTRDDYIPKRRTIQPRFEGMSFAGAPTSRYAPAPAADSRPHPFWTPTPDVGAPMRGSVQETMANHPELAGTNPDYIAIGMRDRATTASNLVSSNRATQEDRLTQERGNAYASDYRARAARAARPNFSVPFDY